MEDSQRVRERISVVSGGDTSANHAELHLRQDEEATQPRR